MLDFNSWLIMVAQANTKLMDFALICGTRLLTPPQ
jgi:hypothetical protein